jgi:hypothetical protein
MIELTLCLALLLPMVPTVLVLVLVLVLRCAAGAAAVQVVPECALLGIGRVRIAVMAEPTGEPCFWR